MWWGTKRRITGASDRLYRTRGPDGAAALLAAGCRPTLFFGRRVTGVVVSASRGGAGDSGELWECRGRKHDRKPTAKNAVASHVLRYRSYGRAIAGACKKAWPAPEEIRGDKEAVKAWDSEHRWSPNQLRHTRGPRCGVCMDWMPRKSSSDIGRTSPRSTPKSIDRKRSTSLARSDDP